MNSFAEISGKQQRADGSSELIGTVERVLWLSEDKTTVIAALRDGSIVKGDCPPTAGLIQGTCYRFLGRWEEHRKHGPQFRFDTLVRDVPHDPEGVAKYLADLIPGVGTVKAGALVHHLGLEAAAIIRERPDAAVECGVLSHAQAAKAAEILSRFAATESTRIDLFALLKGRGFSQKLIEAAIDKWGAAAADTVRKNPYAPMLNKLPSAGFKRCDKLYLDLGRDPCRIKRQALCLLHFLRTDSSGHTWQDADTAARAIIDAIGRDKADPVAAARLLKRCRLLSVRREEDTTWLAEASKARDEWLISENLNRLMHGAPRWPSPDTVESLSEHQRDAIGLHLCRDAVWMLNGSPGCGKTYTAAAVVKGVLRGMGQDCVAVCAPTGKAAVRITAALAEYGIPLQATTIHRLLGVRRNGHDGDGWGFLHDSHNPLEQRVIIVDEFSMCDTTIVSSLLQACGRGTNLLFVGDVNQLPPVGHGSPLRDMIAAGLPQAELTEIQRNAGLIVKACRDIKAANRFAVAEKYRPETGDNLRHFETKDGEESIECLKSILQRFAAVCEAAAESGPAAGTAGGFDPIWETQVLVALNENGEVSRRRLNTTLQDLLNPSGLQAAGNPFRVGDKIICLKNGEQALVDRFKATAAFDETDPRAWADVNEDEFVANGDVGRVLAVGAGVTVAKFSFPDRTVKIIHGTAKENGKSSKEGSGDESDSRPAAGDFDLAYAITTHKSQGSECGCVIALIDSYHGAKMVCSREWWYTAISRAKRLCVLIGQRKVLDKHCRKVNIAKRRTFLRELLTASADPLLPHVPAPPKPEKAGAR